MRLRRRSLRTGVGRRLSSTCLIGKTAKTFEGFLELARRRNGCRDDSSHTEKYELEDRDLRERELHGELVEQEVGQGCRELFA